MSSQRRLDAAETGRSIGPRVLVIDGNRDAADSTVMLLHLWGYDARAAYGGPTALQLAGDFRPHVILAESLSSSLGEHEFARRLHAEAPAAALVALTTAAQAPDRRRLREAGFHFHLVKPADPDQLLETLVRAVRPDARTDLAPPAPR